VCSSVSASCAAPNNWKQPVLLGPIRPQLFSQPNEEPLWKDEFSVFTGDERYVTRRQFSSSRSQVSACSWAIYGFS
jgi:hypothetical protein